MPGLRYAVILAADDELGGINLRFSFEELKVPRVVGKRVNPICQAAVSIRGTTFGCRDRMSQVVQQPVNDSLASDFRSQNSADVLHYKDTRTVLSNNPEVCLIEEMALILLVLFRIDWDDPRASGDGIHLTRRSSD